MGHDTGVTLWDSEAVGGDSLAGWQAAVRPSAEAAVRLVVCFRNSLRELDIINKELRITNYKLRKVCWYQIIKILRKYQFTSGYQAVQFLADFSFLTLFFSYNGQEFGYVHSIAEYILPFEYNFP
jgi:hypothetical protein